MASQQADSKGRYTLSGGLQGRSADWQQSQWGWGTAAAVKVAQGGCQGWVLGAGRVVGQEDTAGEAGGTAIQDRDTGGLQEFG